VLSLPTLVMIAQAIFLL